MRPRPRWKREQERRRRMGFHPLFKQSLREPPGKERCGTCGWLSWHLVRNERGEPKCYRFKQLADAGPSTDVDRSWPACAYWKPWLGNSDSP